jgi:hypothetical protein
MAAEKITALVPRRPAMMALGRIGESLYESREADHFAAGLLLLEHCAI